MNMNLQTRVALTTLALTLTGIGHAALVYDQTFTSGFAGSGYIPDNRPSGWQNSQTVSGLGTDLTITGVRVSMEIGGGWNGDLYAYLSYTPVTGPGALITLMDRPGYSGSGYGYGDPGFAITLSDDGVFNYNPIASYQSYSPSYNGNGQLTGTWKPNDGTTSFHGQFSDLNPNGTWTLFFADLSAGDQSQLISWGLQIEAVPEPTTWALGIFGVLAGGAQLARRWRNRARARHDVLRCNRIAQ
jgi:hypothetical protein